MGHYRLIWQGAQGILVLAGNLRGMFGLRLMSMGWKMALLLRTVRPPLLHFHYPTPTDNPVTAKWQTDPSTNVNYTYYDNGTPPPL